MSGGKFFGRCLMVAVAMAVAGCNSLSVLESKKVDYKSAGKLPPLEVPPDLTALGADDRFAVPDINPQGGATFSAYNKERGSQPQQGVTSNLLPSLDKVHVERSGTQRWLVVNATPDQVWPVVKDFWQEMGFIVKIEVPESGVMETDWAENRAKIPQDAIRNVLGKVLDGLYSTAERDKFRTRLERSEKGETEIYLSHRGMLEVYEGSVSGASTTGRTVWQPRPADPELEADMLRRLMVRFGADEARAKTQMATVSERATITRSQEGAGSLAIVDPFDRAWRRVGLALDRVGFTVEDRDRSKGLYFVRYVDTDAEGAKEDKSFMSKLAFWKSNDKNINRKEQYRIHVIEADSGSLVKVLNKDGIAEKSETTDRILTLLYEQLK